MKPWMRRISWGIASLFFLFMLLLFIWLLINIWPHPEEAKLWSANDLSFSKVPPENGWNQLPKQESPPDHPLEKFIPDEVTSLIPPVLRPLSEVDPTLYWQKVGQFFAGLEDSQGKKEATDYLVTLLHSHHFIDNDPPLLGLPTVHRLYLLDLHRFAWITILEYAAHNEWSKAYHLWTMLWNIDSQWITSARSLFSHILSIECVSGDLTLLSLMIAKSPPPDAKKILTQLRSLNPDDISFKDALIYEYLWQVTAIEGILMQPDQAQEFSSIPVAFFNKALIINDLNAEFRQHLKLMENPESIPEDTGKQFQEEKSALNSGLWWVYNPGGKILQRLLKVNILNVMREFYLKREEVRHQLQLLMNPQSN